MKKLILIMFMILVLPCFAVCNPDPVKVQEVLDGTQTVAYVCWWGFDPNDSTSAIQSAIDSPALTVILCKTESAWIVKPITLRGNQTVIFEDGVVILAKKNEFKGERDCLFSGVNLDNTTLIGYGAVLRMRKEDYHVNDSGIPGYYVASEHRHILRLHDCRDVKVLGFTMEDSGGDGIYIGGPEGDRPSTNVLVKDCICDNSNRQGISITAGDNIVIDSCVLSNTDGTAPQAGIDIEPNTSDAILKNILIKNCVSFGNTGPGYLIYLGRLAPASPSVSIKFEDCHVTGGPNVGIWVGIVPQNLVQGSIEFVRCSVADVVYGGLRFDQKWSGGLKFKFEECVFTNVATDSYWMPIELKIYGPTLQGFERGVEFVDCSVFDSSNQKFLKITGYENAVNADDFWGSINFYRTGDAASVVDSTLDYNLFSFNCYFDCN